jgi:hypothetical protein
VIFDLKNEAVTTALQTMDITTSLNIESNGGDSSTINKGLESQRHIKLPVLKSKFVNMDPKGGAST